MRYCTAILNCFPSNDLIEMFDAFLPQSFFFFRSETLDEQLSYRVRATGPYLLAVKVSCR